MLASKPLFPLSGDNSVDFVPTGNVCTQSLSLPYTQSFFRRVVLTSSPTKRSAMHTYIGLLFSGGGDGGFVCFFGFWPSLYITDLSACYYIIKIIIAMMV